MTRIIRNAVLVLLPVLTLTLGWQLGMRFEHRRLESLSRELESLYSGATGSGVTVADPEKEVNLALLWGVWRLLLQHYIEPQELKVQPMVFGAVRGLVQAVGDPYTSFMTPNENDDFQQSLEGRLEGIGAELTMRNDQVIIVAPLKGSPAAEAGLQPEDIIVEVDEVDIAGETLSQIVHRIRGTKGTVVKLSVWRKGEDELLDFSIIRKEITVPSVETDVKKTGSGTVAVLGVNQFGDQTIPEVEKALQSFLEIPDLDGVVIDLRYNGGGYLEGAVQLTSFFLRQGKVVTVRRRGNADDSHYVYGRPVMPDIPLVVLINEGSASASEITAGALQDHDRAVVIGMTSFGKGTVQEVLELPGGSSLRVTTAKWLTPGGKDLSEEGVHPDIVMERTREEIQAGVDPQMHAALEWLLDNEDVSHETGAVSPQAE